jgi:uncharacterized Zn finger protein (UPF0148 family)
VTVYQCDICQKWYTGKTGWIVCPRCGSKERELHPLAAAIYDAAMSCKHETTFNSVQLFSSDRLPASKELFDRIEARLKELGI